MSELYKNLMEYYHPERKRIPVFIIPKYKIKILRDYIYSFNKKLNFSLDDEDIINYKKIYYNDNSIIITGSPLEDNLYGPLFPSHLYKIFSEAILSYFFNSNDSIQVEYLTKNDKKDVELEFEMDNY